ncbi:hypothetical protein [Adlercreutzia caecimuris]|uniref:hypothetical protein n=1 Tax=Adlercreutzia caecimuris TaxID=671266 RepID=UPI001C3D822E|nr:hypothetical protein [Adlercreutzia caecimuris]
MKGDERVELGEQGADAGLFCLAAKPKGPARVFLCVYAGLPRALRGYFHEAPIRLSKGLLINEFRCLYGSKGCANQEAREYNIAFLSPVQKRFSNARPCSRKDDVTYVQIIRSAQRITGIGRGQIRA